VSKSERVLVVEGTLGRGQFFIDRGDDTPPVRETARVALRVQFVGLFSARTRDAPPCWEISNLATRLTFGFTSMISFSPQSQTFL
jgi:hypothetical protein